MNEHGAEYWSARDIQPLLGYTQWRNFEGAINKAKTSCEQSGNDCDHHFADASKPIPGGKGAVQMVTDYQLSRFACYLIAQNGDPGSPRSLRNDLLWRVLQGPEFEGLVRRESLGAGGPFFITACVLA